MRSAATTSSSWRGRSGAKATQNSIGVASSVPSTRPTTSIRRTFYLLGVTGLTTADVRERVAAGKVNKFDDSSSRSLGEIIRSNVFTRFNALIAVLALVVLVIGSPRDALFAAVMVLNAIIGIAQARRSKATLDRLSVVAAPRLTVIRDGERAVVGREEVVLDDVVLLAPGYQLVVDGSIVEA